MEINVSTKLAGVGSRGRRRDPVPALRKRLGELLPPGECEETVQIVRNFALSSGHPQGAVLMKLSPLTQMLDESACLKQCFQDLSLTKAKKNLIANRHDSFRF